MDACMKMPRHEGIDKGKAAREREGRAKGACRHAGVHATGHDQPRRPCPSARRYMPRRARHRPDLHEHERLSPTRMHERRRVPRGFDPSSAYQCLQIISQIETSDFSGFIQTHNTAKMQNDQGQNVDLYIPRKCSWTNRLLAANDFGAVQINLANIDPATGVYNKTYTTFGLSGYIRAQVRRGLCS